MSKCYYEVMYCEVYFVFLWQAVDHPTADADLKEFRRIRREQNMEFEESLRIDRRKVHTFHSCSQFVLIIITCLFRLKMLPELDKEKRSVVFIPMSCTHFD